MRYWVTHCTRHPCSSLSERYPRLLLTQEIATIKMPDLNCNDVEAAMKVIGGTARNMGISVSA